MRKFLSPKRTSASAGSAATICQSGRVRSWLSHAGKLNHMGEVVGKTLYRCEKKRFSLIPPLGKGFGIFRAHTWIPQNIFCLGVTPPHVEPASSSLARITTVIKVVLQSDRGDNFLAL